MSTNVLQNTKYEVSIVLKASLNEKALAKAIEQIEAELKKLNCEIIKMEEPMARRLGYKIDGNREANLLIIQMAAPSDAPNALRRSLSIMEDVSRFLIVKKDITNNEPK